VSASAHEIPELSLAIETTAFDGSGSVTLAREGSTLGTRTLARRKRHNVELMDAIDHLFREHDRRPADLAERGAIFVSVGPGSFTGIRVGVATAQSLAWALHAPVAPFPTADVLAENVEPASPDNLASAHGRERKSSPREPTEARDAVERLAVERLAVERLMVRIPVQAEQAIAWTGEYAWDAACEGWRRQGEAELLPWRSCLPRLETADRPTAVLTAETHAGLDAPLPGTARLIRDPRTRPRSDRLTRLALRRIREAARSADAHVHRPRGLETLCVDPAALRPLYAQLPEPERRRLEAQRKAGQASDSDSTEASLSGVSGAGSAAGPDRPPDALWSIASRTVASTTPPATASQASPPCPPS